MSDKGRVRSDEHFDNSGNGSVHQIAFFALVVVAIAALLLYLK